MNQEKLLTVSPYSLQKEEKEIVLGSLLSDLTRHHYKHCEPYRRMLDGLGYEVKSTHSLVDIPFLPVRLFKTNHLYSVPRDKIIKTMTSSGTSGQEVSKIFLDKETAVNQTKALAKIVSTFIGSTRSPMLIIDSESVIKDRNLFSARGAGILGFSMFGTKRLFALDDKMNINIDSLIDFIEQNENKRIFLFGFTFMVYQHFISELKRKSIHLDLSNGVLIHGGGWKKLLSESVTNIEFKNSLEQLCGITAVHDYYGMVEQTGSIYMECEYGHLHAPVFSDIVIRKPYDFSPAKVGEKGLIQTISMLPKSYPGHSLLTEDEGILLGEDDCRCGRLGKYFSISGRIKSAEIRGCSDTYAEQF